MCECEYKITNGMPVCVCVCCRIPIPLGERVRPNPSSGPSFRRSQSSLGRLGRGTFSGIWALAPHPRCLGHGGIQRAEGTSGSVGRSVGNSPGRAGSPVFDGTRSWAGPRPWQDPEGRGYWCIGRYIRPVRRLGLHCPGENRVRRESGVPDFSHHPLAPWSMALAIGQGTSWLAGFVYAVRNGLVWWDKVVASSGYGGSIRLCAQCGCTRTTSVVGSHPEMSVWGSVRGTWRWALIHVENRPWGIP